MTPSPIRYKVASTMIQMCGLLGLSLDDFMDRSALPLNALDEDSRGVTAQEYYHGWNALVAEANRSDLPLFLGQAYARGPFNPAFFAFTCSATVRAGLTRLALFKPIVGPLVMSLCETKAGLQILKSANPPSIPLPATFSATEMVFFVKATRNSTARPIVPKSITLTEHLPCHEALEAFFQTTVHIGPRAEITLHTADANLPLLSRNAPQWAVMEPAFQRQLVALTTASSISEQVRSQLIEMLHSGLSNMSETASRLRLSTRSLQRYLARAC